MNLERKYMSKSNWKRVMERKYSVQDIEETNLKGKVSLLWIKKVSSPCYKEYDDITVKIADNGYYWLQVGIENANFWITAMYDENRQFIQYYIDVTRKNHVKDESDPFYEDLFLDLIILDDRVILLDEDELKQASKEKVIDKNCYMLAYNTATELTNWLSSNKQLLDNLCAKYFDILYRAMKKKK